MIFKLINRSPESDGIFSSEDNEGRKVNKNREKDDNSLDSKDEAETSKNRQEKDIPTPSAGTGSGMNTGRVKTGRSAGNIISSDTDSILP